VVVDSSLSAVDELMHIARRLRRIALQSGVGGMALSIAGMGVAAAGVLTPIGGAVRRRSSTSWPCSTRCAPRARRAA